MNGVEGVEGTSWSTRYLANAAKKPGEEAPSRYFVEAHESGAGMDGALTLGREFLGENLSSSGFTDVRAGIVTGLKTFLEQGLSQPQEVETGLDIRMAGELATLTGAQVTGEVNLVLRILARVDPARVAALLH